MKIQNFNMRRVLITGGAGFLGSHLCDRLVAEDFEVLCVDNCFTGTRQNIFHLLNKPNFEFIRQFDPVQTTKTSVHGAINMLGLAKRVKAKILQASTSEVYGDPDVHPQPETYWGRVNPIGPRSCYDEGKRCAETLFFDYYRQHNLKIKVARIFNTYGPRMHPNDGRVVSNFIVQALKNKDITVFGDGTQTRSFCYVDDLIEGLIRMMSGPDDFVGPVNLGNPDEFTILELAKKIVEITNSKSKIVFKPLPQDDPVQRRPDISLAKEKLKWQPVVKLDQGLKKTIKYFDTILNP
jgi:UDP-glucuronate decarboxylase